MEAIKSANHMCPMILRDPIWATLYIINVNQLMNPESLIKKVPLLMKMNDPGGPDNIRDQ